MFVPEATTVLKEVNSPWVVRQELIKIQKTKDLARPVWLVCYGVSINVFVLLLMTQQYQKQIELPAHYPKHVL